MKKRASYFTLLEVLVALGLTTLLITVLLGSFEMASRVVNQLEREEQKQFYLFYADARLQQVLPAALSPFESPTKKNRDFFFFTEDNHTLIFSYNNGLGSGADFSNYVLSKLFIDAEERLILLTWPAPSRTGAIHPPMRKEVLLTHVSNLHFSFYRPPRRDKGERSIQPEAEGVSDQWFPTWNQKDHELPALMKLYMTHKGEELEFFFVLPNTENTLFYP